MGYSHDIFISYRRNPETHTWITQHFVPLLQVRVDMVLGRRPSVFVDNQIESGTSWPVALGNALGASRVIIVLWTANYLRSRWCAAELSHMLNREHTEALRTVKDPYGIVLPVFIHDGKSFPQQLSHIQYFAMQQCFNLRMAHNSPRAEELDAILAQESESIAACIEGAPAWRAHWREEATQKLFDMFYKPDEPAQLTVPRFTGV
jgi:hypothetical protein